MKQKIAVVCNYELLPERVGGMDYFFWMFDEKCKSEGLDVDWFFPNTAVHGKYADLKIISSEYQNSEVFFADYISRNSNTYSHIFTHFVELCTPVFKKISAFSKAKIIAVDHNPRPLEGYSLKKRMQKKIKGLLYSRYIDLFVGVSNYTVSELVKDFGTAILKKTQTLYNGVQIDSIATHTNRARLHPKFVVVSHLRESKGIQDLIAAVSLLPDAIKAQITFDVFGDGPYKDALLAKVKTENLEQNFKFLGSNPNLKNLVCHYDYMVQPTHMECFSLSILESLAANVPVITTDVGGNQEAVAHNDNGFIFKAKNIVALKFLLEAVFTGEKQIVGNTRKLIDDRFSLRQMTDNYFKLLSRSGGSIL